MKGIGATGVSGLAGCAGDSDGNSTGSGGGSTGSDGSDGASQDGGSTPSTSKVIDRTFKTWEWVNPAERTTWNQFATSGYIRIDSNVGRLMFEKLAFYNRETQKYEPWIAKDWNIKSDEVVLTLDQDFKWADGESYSADDLLVEYRMKKYVLNDANWDNHPYIASVEKLADDKFRFGLSRPVNPELFILNEIARRVGIKGSIYREHLKRFEDASSDKEIQKIREEITGGGDTEGLVIEDPSANGPWKLKEKRESEYLLERNEQYKFIDNLNFSQAKTIYYGSDQKKWQALRTGEIDGSAELTIPAPVKKTFPEWVNESTQPCWCGLTLMFQFGNDLYARRNVREAFAWFLNREKIRQNQGPDTHTLIKIPSGIKQDAISGYKDGYLGDVADQFETYAPKSSNTEKATQLLEKEGFSKEGDAWYKPNGERWSVEVKTATQNFWATFAQAVVTQMQEFGIDAKAITIDNNTYWGTTFANGDYNLAVNWSGGWNPHPWFTFDNDFINAWQHPGQNYPGPVDSKNEYKVEIPPTGKPDGKPQTFDLQELVGGIQTAQDKKKERELVQKVAWVYNYDLPKIPVSVKSQQMWTTAKDWWYAPQDNSAWDYGINTAPSFHLPRRGKMRAKPK